MTVMANNNNQQGLNFTGKVNNLSSLFIISDYQTKKAVLQQFLERNKDTFNELFKEKVNNDYDKIPVTEYYNFLKDCFSFDTILLFENKDQQEDFFKDDNNAEKLIRWIDEYYINEQKIGNSLCSIPKT